jgi:hypothetical protein
MVPGIRDPANLRTPAAGIDHPLTGTKCTNPWMKQRSAYSER